MAILSMEAPLSLVGLMECGVVFQIVIVSGMDFVYCLFIECIVSHTANCPDLPSLTNGMIMYSPAGSNDNRPFLASAVHSCNTGYTLIGGTTRKCVNGGSWDGSAPTCQRQ